MQEYLLAFKNYANFSGRSRRREYWMFYLFNMAIVFLFSIASSYISPMLTILSALYGLAVIIPQISITVRRLHDAGKSGWFILVSLIPIVGVIWLLVLLCTDSVSDNQYGPNPKMQVS